MSDISVQDTNSLSKTLLAGSEEDFEVICDYCHADGRRVEADGYCVDCGEHLCVACKNIHTKTSATRSHVLQDKSNMPRAQQVGSQTTRLPDATDPLKDRCKKHPKELIKFFCNSHKQLGCSVCLSLDHRTCNDVSYIPDVSSRIPTSDELKATQSHIKKLIHELECSKTWSEHCQRVTDESYKLVVSEVQQFRENIKQILDRLEEDLLKKASTLRKETSEFLLSQGPRCDDLIKDIKKMNSDIDTNIELKHNNQLFIAMMFAKEKIQVLQQEADSINTSLRTRRFVFSHNSRLDDLTSSVTSLGTLSMIVKPEDVRIKFLHDIYVKSDTDTKDCLITSAVVLPDGQLAVTDFNNKCVKLVDIVGRKASEQVSLTSTPKHITLIGDDQLAVTLNDENHIQVMSLTPRLSVSHTVTMPGCYRGIAYNAGKLILACYKPAASVHICDMAGNLLQKIDRDNIGNQLFVTPSCLALCQAKDTIYISDFIGNQVVCMNSSGEIMTTYAHDRLHYPEGVAVDDDRCVYVCSRRSSTVHQLSASGQLVKILLEEKDGIWSPLAIAHSSGNLYISSASGDPAHHNNIKAYKLV